MRVEKRAHTWIRAISERAPVLITLIRNDEDDGDNDTKHAAPREEDRGRVARLFYPAHVIEEGNVPYVIFAKAKCERPLQMDFTFYDSNSVSRECEDADDSYGVGFRVTLCLQLPQVSRASLLPPLPVLPRSKDATLCLQPATRIVRSSTRTSPNRCATLGGNLNVYMSNIEGAGTRHNVVWLMGLSEQEHVNRETERETKREVKRKAKYEAKCQRQLAVKAKRAAKSARKALAEADRDAKRKASTAETVTKDKEDEEACEEDSEEDSDEEDSDEEDSDEDDSDEEESDDDDYDEDTMSLTHDIQLHRVLFDAVQRADLFPPVLRATYARCMLYAKVEHMVVLKELASLVDLITHGRHVRVLFHSTCDVRRALYQQITRSSKTLLANMTCANAMISKERAYADTHMLSELSTKDADLGERLAKQVLLKPHAPDFETFAHEFRRIVLFQHITVAVERRKCVMPRPPLPKQAASPTRALCDHYVYYACKYKIASWLDHPLTFDRLIRVVCDTLLLCRHTDYVQRVREGFDKRRCQIREEEEEELTTRCEYAYDAYVRHHGETPDWKKQYDRIETDVEIKTRCRREALAVMPALPCIDDLRARFHAGTVEFA
jgi:hypothetical protein